MSCKVLIVDDEQIEREGLKAILAKGLPGLSIELARNGDEAVEKSEVVCPDLVLMDIKMPGISGLEAVRRIRETCPDTKFIMVTAYDTFEYARSAIKLGVRDYLLKPSRAGEIVATVGKVLDEIAAERKEREARGEAERTLQRMLPILETDAVTQLLYDHAHEVHIAELVPLLGGHAAREAFVLLLVVNAEEGAGPLHAELREFMRECGYGWVGALSGRQIPLIVFREEGISYRAQAASLIRRLLALGSRFPGLRLFIGVGTPCASLDEIRFSYQEALIATADTEPPARHRFYEDMPTFHGLTDDDAGKTAEKQFIDYIRSGKWTEVERFVTAFIDRCEKNGLAVVHAGQRVLELLWIIAGVLAEAGIEAEKPTLSFQMQNYRELRAEAGTETAKLVRTAESRLSGAGPCAIHRIKRYIVDHAHEDISLEQIAALVNLSPFYVSKMFKEETGQNYVEFLTDCRIEKAKSLLADPRRSLKEIAFETGYRDPNYFSKVFRKVTGLAPSEFRRQRIGDGTGSGMATDR